MLLIKGKLIFVFFLALLRKVGPKSADDCGYFCLIGLRMIFLNAICLGFGEAQIRRYWRFWFGNWDIEGNFCLNVFFLRLIIRLVDLLFVLFLWLYGLCSCLFLFFFLFQKLYSFLNLFELFLLIFLPFDCICLQHFISLSCIIFISIIYLLWDLVHRREILKRFCADVG